MGKKLIVKLKRKGMKKMMILGALAVSVALYSCKDDSDRVDVVDIPGQTIELAYDFESDDEGWNAGISDIPSGELDNYFLDADHESDVPFDSNGALRVAASNPNNEFFLYVSKKLTGLEPNTRYNVSFNIDFAANVMVDTTGVVIDTTGVAGDTTGVIGDTIDVNVVNLNDSIILKAGAVAEEPATEPDDLDFLRLIFDKGEVGIDGSDMIVLGRYSSSGDFVKRSASNEDAFLAFTNEDGELWLVVGAESTGEEIELYFDAINVEIDE
jgi:predicted nucleotidyltransferase